MATAEKKAKFAFGSEQNIASALASGAIDAYDILLLDEKKIGWIDKNGQTVIASGEQYVVEVESLPTENGKDGIIYLFNDEAYVWNGAQCVPLAKEADLTAIEAEIAKKVDEATVDAKIEKAVDSVAIEITEF